MEQQGKAANPPFSFDEATDVFTFGGIRICGELLRKLCVTPCGETLRVVDRDRGVFTVSVERDPLALAAPDMLATLKNVRVADVGRDLYIGVIALDGCASAKIDPEDVDMFRAWGEQLRQAIAKAEARS